MHATPAMQWLVNFLSRLLCTCGARSLPPSVPPSPPSPLTPNVHDDSPPTSGSKSPPSPSSSVLQEVLSHIPSHASPRSPSPSDNSFLTQLPNDELPPQHTPMVDLPGTRDATPMKAPPPRHLHAFLPTHIKHGQAHPHHNTRCRRSKMVQ